MISRVRKICPAIVMVALMSSFTRGEEIETASDESRIDEGRSYEEYRIDYGAKVRWDSTVRTPVAEVPSDIPVRTQSEVRRPKTRNLFRQAAAVAYTPFRPEPVPAYPQNKGMRTFTVGPIQLQLPAGDKPDSRVQRTSANVTTTSAIPPGPVPTHSVIQAPHMEDTSGSHHGVHHGSLQDAVKELHRKKEQTHPPHDMFRQRHQPEPAGIPHAQQRATWKAPYSYGYFGAPRDRNWSRHFGYRDRGTAWTLR